MILAGVGVGFMLYVVTKIAMGSGEWRHRAATAGGLVAGHRDGAGRKHGAPCTWRTDEGGRVLRSVGPVARGDRRPLRSRVRCVARDPFRRRSSRRGGASRAVGSQCRAVKAAPGEQMLVESDQLVYDYDHNTVSAVGNVKIYYAGYTLEAEKVTYIKPNGRLIASRPGQADRPDRACHLCRADSTSPTISATASSSRSASTRPTRPISPPSAPSGRTARRPRFVNGVYTACEPCKDHPETAAALAGPGRQDHHQPQGEDDLFPQCARSNSSGVPIA